MNSSILLLQTLVSSGIFIYCYMRTEFLLTLKSTCSNELRRSHQNVPTAALFFLIRAAALFICDL